MLILATLVAFVAIGGLGMLIEGYRATPDLADAPFAPLTDAPRVSIVVAARDESHAIEEAVRTFARQDYPDLEIVAVDDRSSDETGAILERMAIGESRLRVVRVRDLPAGWLGKTHALQRGAEVATGSFLLFTDADVMLDPTTVTRAVAFMQAHRLDHLALGPEMVLRSLPITLAVSFFIMAFMLFQRPWRAIDSRSTDHIGIGAFNLVRREWYERAGGHERVRLRPDDDVKLGKALKLAGARQQFAGARGLVRVEWYRSVTEMTRGLRKNSFAGMEYRTSLALGAIVSLLVVHVLPFVAVVLAEGAARVVWIIACIALMSSLAFNGWRQRKKPWLALLYPVAALIFTWIFARNIVLTLAEGGIDWRGTRYSLEELRRNRV